MAEEKKIVTMDLLSVVKEYVDNNDGDAIKSADFEGNKVKLYTNKEKSGSPAFELDLPEEMYLDLAKTELVEDFEWSIETYPDSEDPDLDGEPVLVLAVKGDDSVSYSFISIKDVFAPYTGNDGETIKITVEGSVIKGELKISAESNNALKKKSDGVGVFASSEGGNVLEVKDDGTLYVPTPETSDVEISEESDNALVSKDDGLGVFASTKEDNMLEVDEDGGLYVPAVDPGTGLTFASTEEIRNMFK